MIVVLSSLRRSHSISIFFFFNDTATTEIYTLSLHDALPISTSTSLACAASRRGRSAGLCEKSASSVMSRSYRSEEHTSELQSQSNLVCRLLLEKKKKKSYHTSSGVEELLESTLYVPWLIRQS